MQSVTITNAAGLELTVLAWGGTIQSLKVPDRLGHLDNIVLGFADPAGYAQPDQPYFGATLGRVGGRIANARFELDGQTYQLFANNNGHSLHGGERGFSFVPWDLAHHGQQAILHRRSPDGEEGYPGNLDVTVTYELTDANELRMEFTATTDAPTPVNLSNHAYFNLKGEGRGDVLDHVCTIQAAHFLPVDRDLIPTGEIRPVDGTPFDFRQPTPFRAGFTDGSCPEIVYGHGYDITYQLNRTGLARGEMAPAVRLEEPSSGRTLTIATTAPSIQFYTGSTLDSSFVGASGQLYHQAAGVCFETQHFPDSPNHPEFPSIILQPGETYSHASILTFGVA